MQFLIGAALLIVVMFLFPMVWVYSVMEKAGAESKAKSIVFSLPVTDTAGLRLIED